MADEGKVSEASKAVGRRVRQMRLATKGQITQDDLASAAGVGQSAISRIEGGAREVSVGELVGLAERFGVSPADLLGLAASPSSQPPRPESAVEARRLVAEGLKMLDRVLGR